MSAVLYSAVSFDQTSNLFNYEYAIVGIPFSTGCNLSIQVCNAQLGIYLGFNPVGSFTVTDGPFLDSHPFGFSVITSSAPLIQTGPNDFTLNSFPEIIGFGTVVVPDPPTPTATIAVPELSTWAMLLLGLLSILRHKLAIH